MEAYFGYTGDPLPADSGLHDSTWDDKEKIEVNNDMSDYIQAKMKEQIQNAQTATQSVGGALSGALGRPDQGTPNLISQANLRSEEHINHLINTFSERMTNKYRAGVRQHGGYLPDMVASKLLDNAIDEAIDMVVYLLTLKDNLGV